jgi:S-disulfanyl-L-cysteine oxidoreductase SoxD
MFSCLKTLAAVLAALAMISPVQADRYTGIGRAATPKEVAAWDIDVRPDLKGLPKGAGSVAKGMEVWEGKCAGCHGIFGESNEVFMPIVGGTGPEDIKTGRVARLLDRSYPGRTTMMKMAHVSTLWDYINRAMPWTQPKSLATEEVYAVTAYILNLGGVLPDDFVLSDQNMAQVQQRLPNRNGMRTDHGLWPGKGIGDGKPDVRAVACMKDCATEATVASFLPEFARNAHGNLAEQNRPVGAQRGADTSRPMGAAAPAAMPASARRDNSDNGAAAARALAQKNACVACHAVDAKLVGPSFRDIQKKYAQQGDAAAYLAGKIRAGSVGVWGGIPMPAQSLGEAEAQTLARWLLDGAPQ